MVVHNHHRPTIVSVAERAGVSKSLASRALRGEPGVSQEKRERILTAAAELGYAPNLAARSLRGDSRTIAMILNSIGNPHYTDIVYAAEEAAAAAGYTLILSHADGSAAKISEQLQRMLSYGVSGVILASSRADVADLELVQELVPTVVLSRYPSYPAEVSVFASDDETGAARAAALLVDGGATDLAYVTVSSSFTSVQRWRGFSGAASARGVRATLIVTTAEALTERDTEVVEQLAEADGILANNDVVAAQVLGVARHEGRAVPEQLQIIGYDNTVFAQVSSPELSSVDQPQSHLGRRAVAEILGRIEDPSQEPAREVYVPTVVRRQSTRA